MSAPTPPPTPNIAAHGPYEDLGIAMLRVIEKLIDGQSPDQRVKLWQNWIDFWQPFVDLISGKAK